MSATERFREPGELRWQDPVLVVCPRCQRQATVSSPDRASARLLCPACTLLREWTNDRLFVLINGRRVTLRRDHGAWLDLDTGRYEAEFETVEGEDRRFGVPLWLRLECCGGKLLWANNEAHLSYLESYVGATLRERPEGPSGLSWYLPGWMKQAKHRDELLRAIARLRESLSA